MSISKNIKLGDLSLSESQQGYLLKARTGRKVENSAHSGYYVLTRGSLECYKTENKVSEHFNGMLTLHARI